MQLYVFTSHYGKGILLDFDISVFRLSIDVKKVLMNPKVDQYLMEGCMRCPLGGTSQCKVHSWHAELQLLRSIVLECALTEEVKWGVPCYTVDGKNVLIVSAFKEYAAISFFKGALMTDPHGILIKQGPHSQAGRLIKYTHTDQIAAQHELLKSYIIEAVSIENLGLKIPANQHPEPIPDELLHSFEEDPPFRDAFDLLTPGRQRGYIIYFSQPKQSATRAQRIIKMKEQIFKGIGMHDKYSGRR
jgi:uncharacterized protein YdeI (YjbR/CyaY-like superfamily)